MNTIPIPHNTTLSKAEQQHLKLQTQARKWVAQTFYGTMLKQMHNSPFKDKMFSGGRGGEAFQSMMDQQLADKMSKSAGSKLVDTIVSHIENPNGDYGGKFKMRKPAAKVVPPPQLNVRA